MTRGRDPRHFAELQRARLMHATIAAVEEYGYPRVTVAAILARAGVSRKTFYDLYGGVEDAVLAVFTEAVAEASGAALAAHAAEGDWWEGTRAALAVVLELIEAQPARARLCIISSLAGGPAILTARARVTAGIAEALEHAPARRDGPGAPSPLIAEATVGGIATVIHSQLRDAGAHGCRELLGALMSMLVLPYLGAARARSELARPLPESRIGRPGANGRAAGHGDIEPSDPLAGLDIRLTYRTMRVLGALADRPGSSNRLIGVAAGITDQGQISKLLARLMKLGLAENHGGGQACGAANAWYLTVHGAQLEAATRRVLPANGNGPPISARRIPRT